MPKSCQPGYKPVFYVGVKKAIKPVASPVKATNSPKRHTFLQATSRKLIQKLQAADKQPVGVAVSRLNLARKVAVKAGPTVSEVVGRGTQNLTWS